MDAFAKRTYSHKTSSQESNLQNRYRHTMKNTFKQPIPTVFVTFLKFLFEYMSHILHTSTVQKTASLADDGNSVYSQFSGAHNIKHI